MYIKTIHLGQTIMLPLYAKEMYTKNIVFAMVTLATALNNNRLSTWLPYLQVLSSDSSQALME